VNFLGYVATNMLEGNLKTFQWHEIDQLQQAGEFFLDVREKQEVERRALSGAAHIPLDQLRDRHMELPTDRIIHIYCHAGLRGYLAYRILDQLSYVCKNLDGGYKTFLAAKAEMISPAPREVITV